MSTWYSPSERICVPDIPNNVYAQQQAATCLCLPTALLQSAPPQRSPGSANRDCSPSQRGRRLLPSRQHPQPSVEQKYLASPHMANYQYSRQQHWNVGKTADKKTSAGLQSAWGAAPGRDARSLRLPALTHRHGFVRSRLAGSGET